MLGWVTLVQMLQEISTKKLIDGVPHFKEVRQEVFVPVVNTGNLIAFRSSDQQIERLLRSS